MDKVVELVAEGLLSTGPTPSSFYILHHCTGGQGWPTEGCPAALSVKFLGLGVKDFCETLTEVQDTGWQMSVLVDPHL